MTTPDRFSAASRSGSRPAGGTFPFGQPVAPTRPSAVGPKRLFVLGAYPSALHVRWAPPAGQGRVVRALAVDNEPRPFWNGADQEERVLHWQRAVGWRDEFGSS